MRRDDPGPYSLDALASLTPPALFTTDANVWKPRLVAWFQEASGRTLYPMQVEMLLIETLAYAMSVMGEEVQRTVEEELVAFASDDGLDRLGPNRSTPRLPPSRARTTMRFEIAAARPSSVVIPAGTRVSAGGQATFQTLQDGVVPIGATWCDLTAEAVEAGLLGNGFQLGSIAAMLDPIAGVTATNVTISDGGSNFEARELYRLRLANAFERISTGGSFAWYRETAMGVSSALIDVGVVRPQPCVINLYPLTLDGAAGVDLRNQVAATFDTEEALDIRFGDDVSVIAPSAVDANPVLTVRCAANAATIQAQAIDAGNAILLKWRQQLASTIAPSEIETAVKAIAGVIDVSIAGGGFQKLTRSQFYDATPFTPDTVHMVIV